MAVRIQMAPREFRRQVFDAVGRSFLKTLTEPVTNADSILKKQAGVAHTSGLLDKVFGLKGGDRLNTTELKTKIPQRPLRKITVDIVTSGKRNRLCRIIDTGTGMSENELNTKFGTLASAKAKGEKTRSLFGRGALDVLLYHQESVIYSVRDNILSSCQIYFEKTGSKDPMCDVKSLGKATKSLLRSHDLPVDILDHGTVFQFRLKERTRIPQEDQIISKISSFYMLRLISSDPNTEVEIVRERAAGKHTDVLSFDFPLGTVVGRVDDVLELKGFEPIDVNILVARSDVALDADPINIDRRENGLLFVDDNDAVLDLTLLPEYDRNPYLKQIYGFVRINGLREVLEMKLEDDEAEAVLTPSRDGFDKKNEITKQIFALVEKHVKDIYVAEEKKQKQGGTKRSEALEKRVNEALKALNQFNSEETDDEGTSDEETKPRPEPIYFSVDATRLTLGATRRVSVYVNFDKVSDGEIVLFESDNADIKVEPDSSVVKFSKKETHQRIAITLSSDVKGAKGVISALSLDKDGKEIKAELRILGVVDAPVFEPPEDIAFTAPRFSGEPNTSRNASLLVNLAAFDGLPNITFLLDEVEGNVTIQNEPKSIHVQVTEAHRIAGKNVARVVVPFMGTGWGQTAVLRASAKRVDGKECEAECKLKFERPKGDEKFNDFVYDDLERPVLGDVAGDKLYINSGYSLHRQIFGDTQDDFQRSLEVDPYAQMRAVSVLVETAVFHTATTKFLAGGKKGLDINPDDPIGSLRPYMDESKMKLEPKLYQALVKPAIKEQFEDLKQAS